MNLYLDDERPLPAGYDRKATTAPEAVALLRAGGVEALSLDHDLGPPEAGTGYDVAVFVEEAAFKWSRGEDGGLPPVKLACHSANPAGAARINWAISRAMRFWAVGARRLAGTLPAPKPHKPRYAPTGTEYLDWVLE